MHFHYPQVNEAINSVIFDGRFEGRPVYLDIEDRLLTDISEKLNIDAKTVPSTVSRAAREQLLLKESNPFTWYESQYLSWWLKGVKTAPPYTALLCTLSIAAENMRDDEKFSRNNYYNRLLELLKIDSVESQEAVKKHFKKTKKYWDSLNRWLNLNHGDLGYPTAAPVISHWKYVSYPISQALIREADRKHLQKMFEEYGLIPGETFTVPEMVDYIQQWVVGNRAHAWLTQLWNNDDLKEKIAQTAVLELESWTGSSKRKSGEGSAKRCTLYALRTGWLKPEIRFTFAVSEVGLEVGMELSVDDEGPTYSALAFDSSCDRIFLKKSSYEKALAISATSNVLLSPALSLGFNLVVLEKPITIVRHGRSIIPLVRNTDGISFREVTRVTLLEEHIVVCNASLFEKVEKHLNKYTRKGLKVYQPGELKGLPEDWGAYLKVEFLQIPEEDVDQNLECLTALGDTSIAITDGLRLFRQDWHRLGGLEVTGVTGKGTATIELVSPDLLKGKEEVIGRAEGERCAVLTLDISNPIQNGHYDLLLKQNSSIKKRLHISVSDALHPRSRRFISAAELYYAPNKKSPLGSLSAEENSNLPKRFIRGMSVIGGPRPQIERQDDLVLGDMVQDKREDVPPVEPGPFSLSRLEGYAQACAVRGYHIWKCETFQPGENPRRAMLMTCSDCNRVEIAKNRGKKNRNQKKYAAQKTELKAATAHLNKIVDAVRNKTTYDANILFDAVCFYGGGQANKLRNIADLAGIERWSPQSFIAALFGCGHIDIQMRKDLTTPENWWTAPPCLVEFDTYDFFFSGFRSEVLVCKVKEQVENLGAEVRFDSQDYAPDAIFVYGLSLEELQEELSEISDPYKRPLTVTERPGARIAALVNPASEILGNLPETYSIPEKELEQFDTSRGRWRSVPEISSPGAYRTKGYGRIYFIADGNGQLRRAPYSLAKAYACKVTGTCLHTYEAESKTFISAIGCPPFGLLERALISCSGLLPRTEGGVLKYYNVPEDVAKLVLKRLYL